MVQQYAFGFENVESEPAGSEIAESDELASADLLLHHQHRLSTSVSMSLSYPLVAVVCAH
jgi:hypothetical protein